MPEPTATTAAPGLRRGLLGGLAAYLLWGFFPLYWPLLSRAGAVEILAQRVVWSLVFGLLGCLLLRRRFWRGLDGPRAWATLLGAGVLISVNWGTYIWAVNNGHVLDAALGYYINPILSILLGVVFLKERLSRLQWLAVGLAAIAVIVLTMEVGGLPWAALAISVSFGLYGLLKKSVRIDALSGMVVEGLGISVVAVAFLGWLQTSGHSSFTAYGPCTPSSWSPRVWSPWCRCCSSPTPPSGYRSRRWGCSSTWRRRCSS
ncbi:EamA family transporter RarD [Raineyella fluvialis]|uniref:EamA family transporter RarD n=1 Tax=Raineyella fluvialis TaxID=2662261 RepID=UPI001E47201F|nr:EamA family transporter RarD [Raineyella fluvialis]